MSLSCVGQDLDTLIKSLDSMPYGTERVDQLNTITTQLREGNIYDAVKYGMEAKSLSEDLNYQSGLQLACENLGWIYYRRGIYSSAFELSQRALEISEEMGDSIAIARCLNNVGAISYEKAKYEDAIRHFERGYVISKKMGDVETSVRSLNNISFSFLGLGKMDSAEFYALKALEASRLKRQGYLPAFSFRLLGDIAFETGDMGMSLRHYAESMRISEETENYFIQASTLHRIGKVYAKQKKFASALNVLKRNVSIAKENGYADELERTYKLISEINYARNDAAASLEFLMKHLAIHDSLTEQRNNEQLSLLSSQFESEIKQSQIELLLQNAKIQDEELQRQQVWIYFYVGCFVLGTIIVTLLIYSNQKIKRVNQELKERTDQVSQQAAQLISVNKTKDKLLSIIGHDIRSPLSSLRGMLNIAKDDNVSKEEFIELTSKIGNHLDIVNEDLGNLLQWAQSQLEGLNVKAENFNLKSMVDEVISIFTDASSIKNISLINEIESDVTVVADTNHTRLILRNFISNAIKFSRKNSHVIIANEITGSFVNVSIKDSGIGLSEDEIPKLFNPTSHFTKMGTANEKGMGVGLLLTKEFIDKNGGEVCVESEPGKGSTFSFTLRKAI